MVTVDRTLNGARALLFDLGGVVIDVDFDRVFAHWAAAAECDPAQIKRRFAADEAYRRHETGRMEAAEFFDHLRASLAIDLSDRQFLDGWNAIFAGEIPGIAALLAKAAERIPLYAFTNTNPSHVAHYIGRFRPVLAHFREIFISSRIGMRKPDAEAFDFVIKAIGVPAETIVFFDDLIENVEAAEARRMRGIHVTSSADVAAAIATLGL